MTEKDEGLRLKVAEAHQQDVGKGIARISSQHMATLGVAPGEPIEVKGHRTTGAIAAPAYPPDEGLDIIRIDGLIRSNAGVGIGDTAEVRKASWQEAAHVTLAPVVRCPSISMGSPGATPSVAMC